MQESEGQGDEAKGEGQAEEEKPEDAEDLWGISGQVATARAIVTAASTTDTIEEQCLGLADKQVGDWLKRGPDQRRLFLPCKQMRRNSTQANNINNGRAIIEVERHLCTIIASLKQKHHVQEGSRLLNPQLLISPHARMRISLAESTNVQYVLMR